MNSTRLVSASAGAMERKWFRFLLGLFLTIGGVRMYLVQKFAASVAYGDDLDGIAHRILLPWTQGKLTWSALFAAHNGDHRIVATRLWEMLWFAINGSWDPKLVMIAKVPIYATAAVIFIHLLTGRLERHRHASAAVLAALFAFPFAFPNLLWGFQSQFDFFLLSAALGWLLVLKGRTMLALAISAASILTLASGPIIAASYIPLFVTRWLEGKWHVRRAAAYTVVALAILALGMISPTKEAKPHVGSPAEKTEALVRLYGWPFSNLVSIVERLPETEKYIPAAVVRFPSREHSWIMRTAGVMHRAPWVVMGFDALCAAFLIAPTWLLVLALVRGRVPLAVAIGPLALAGFSFLMLVATALARADEVTVAPRFLDHVALVGYSSLAAGVAVIARNARWRRAFMLWAIVLGLGYGTTMVITMAQMARRRPAAALAVLQRYYATTPHDHSVMIADDNFRRFIVEDDPTEFMSELDRPGLERVLPLEMTAPDAAAGPAARVAFALARYAWVLALIGVGVAFVASRRARRQLRVPAAAPAVPDPLTTL